MPLESCMIILDNSEYMRNGDYIPTRFQAQVQAVGTVFSAKVDSNPESGVGVMTMAGKSPTLLVTPSNDIGKLLSATNRAQIGGTIELSTAISIAQLALKHRENKNQKQRIVAFVGSPVSETQDALVKLGKKLRKNNVWIDIAVFGEEGMEEEAKLQALVNAVGDESHLVTIPPGAHLMSDMIKASPILFNPEAPGASGGMEGMGDDGLDADMDPELAMAIRMSLMESEEAARRQQREAEGASAAGPSAATLPAGMTGTLTNADADAAAAPGDSGPSSSAVPAPVPATPAAGSTSTGAPPGAPARAAAAQAFADEGDDEDEDEMLRRAMALSRGDAAAGGDDVVMAGEGDDEDEEDEEEAIRRAIAMSLEDQHKDKDAK